MRVPGYCDGIVLCGCLYVILSLRLTGANKLETMRVCTFISAFFRMVHSES